MLAEKVYTLCKKIPSGKVSTYKEIGKALHTKAYQAIGQALKKNPYAPEVPCHRVVASNGSLGGFKGKKSGIEIEEKRMLLENEGVAFENGKVNLKKCLYRF
ncbi:MGMT family protein [Candidatus Woesearchaeota archaeon]|nr:MGMT family protein [Candidatus Woesearchaeota archaeon]